MQDAAFTAWRRIGNLREGSSLRPWFLGIVANQCRSLKRNRWWSVTRDEIPESEAPAADLAASIDLRRALPADIGCAAIRLGRVCAGGVNARNCESDVQLAATQIQNLVIALLQNPAPGSLTGKNAQLLSDLAKADVALLAITDAVLNGDAGKMATNSNSYDAYIFAADSDAGAIGNP